MTNDHDQTADDQLICHCMGVGLGEIRAAITAGATTVEQVQDTTQACTGCGTCRYELLELLDLLALRRPVRRGP